MILGNFAVALPLGPACGIDMVFRIALGRFGDFVAVEEGTRRADFTEGLIGRIDVALREGEATGPEPLHVPQLVLRTVPTFTGPHVPRKGRKDRFDGRHGSPKLIVVE